MNKLHKGTQEDIKVDSALRKKSCSMERLLGEKSPRTDARDKTGSIDLEAKYDVGRIDKVKLKLKQQQPQCHEEQHWCNDAHRAHTLPLDRFRQHQPFAASVQNLHDILIFPNHHKRHSIQDLA